jgi:hypothetical protein
MSIQYLNAHPDRYWEGWDFIGPGMLRLTGIALILGGLGLFIPGKWRYVLQIPVVLLGFFFLVIELLFLIP